MNKAIPFLLVLVCSCAAIPGVGVPEGSGRQQSVAVYIGNADFPSDWDDGDVDLTDHDSIGFEFVSVAPDSGLGFELGYQKTDAEGFDSFFESPVALDTTEVYGGVRVSLDSGTSPIVPVLGGGLTLFKADLSVPGFIQLKDTVVSPYAHVGLDYRLHSGLRVGLDYRMVFGAEFSSDGLEADANYNRLALKFGFSF